MSSVALVFGFLAIQSLWRGKTGTYKRSFQCLLEVSCCCAATTCPDIEPISFLYIDSSSVTTPKHPTRFLHNTLVLDVCNPILLLSLYIRQPHAHHFTTTTSHTMASRYIAAAASISFQEGQVPKSRYAPCLASMHANGLTFPISMSPRKYLERRIIRAWKHFSQATRKTQRASILPEDFVLLTARRRSIRLN